MPADNHEISLAGLSKAKDKYVLKRELSSAPPIPIILFFGNPVAFNAKYVMVSIGLETTTIIVSGENFNVFNNCFHNSCIDSYQFFSHSWFSWNSDVITTSLPAVLE
jgi:hypothetical protein